MNFAAHINAVCKQNDTSMPRGSEFHSETKLIPGTNNEQIVSKPVVNIIHLPQQDVLPVEPPTIGAEICGFQFVVCGSSSHVSSLSVFGCR